MKTENKKFKRGTIGYKADQLAKKYGHYANGITILAFALEQALSTEGETFRVPLHQSSVYAAMIKKEGEIIEKLIAMD